MIEYVKWPSPENIVAGITNRQSGDSQGAFADCNISFDVGDKTQAVEKNRQNLASELDNNLNWSWLKQVHGTDVLELPSKASVPLIGDASFTLKSRTVCGVMTADCLPILLCDTEGQFVAAIHAGWRSLAAGIVENTIDQLQYALQTHGKLWCEGEVLAWLGPAISKTHFEVGPEVRRAFVDGQSKENRGAFVEKSDGKYWANIFELAKIRLAQKGVSQTFCEEQCTYTDSKHYYSYRRDGQTGRMFSFIYKT